MKSSILILAAILSTSAMAQTPDFCKEAMDKTKPITERIDAGETCKIEKELAFCKSYKAHETERKINCLTKFHNATMDGTYRKDWIQELTLLTQMGQ